MKSKKTVERRIKHWEDNWPYSERDGWYYCPIGLRTCFDENCNRCKDYVDFEEYYKEV